MSHNTTLMTIDYTRYNCRNKFQTPVNTMHSQDGESYLLEDIVFHVKN